MSATTQQAQTRVDGMPPTAPGSEQARDSLIGIELQGYVITRALSSGGMGIVYEAKHKLIGQRAAVKVLHPELSADSDLTARFLREARAISAIKHPNVVEILNFGVLPGGGQYMLMELLEGETLGQLIERTSPMLPSQALKICDEILAALVAAHQVGVVHRDLKPANMILCKQSSDDLIVKVLDFGLARQFDTSPERPINSRAPRQVDASILAGTPAYISPEQAAGRTVDGQADLYCLGVILFEMLSGRLPFESEKAFELLQMHRSELPPRVSSLIPGIAPDLDAFVDRLLAKLPCNRPASAKAARRIVHELREGNPDATVVAAAAATPRKFNEAQLADTVMHFDLGKQPPRRSRPRMMGAALLFAAVAVLAATLGTSAATPARNKAPAPPAAPTAPPPEPIVDNAVELAAAAGEAKRRALAAPAPALRGANARAYGLGARIAASARTAAPRGSTLARIAVAAVEQAPSPAARPAIVRKAPQVRRSTAAPPSIHRSGCSPSPTWRRGVIAQIETLEQTALASVTESAEAEDVAQIKSRARSLARVANNEEPQCEQVEALLQAWRRELR